MTALRDWELNKIHRAILSELKEPPIEYSAQSVRNRRNALKSANEVLSLFLTKIIGNLPLSAQERVS